MACEIAIAPQVETQTTVRYAVTSYDSGFEHSVEHLIEIRQMVEETNERPEPVRALRGILLDLKAS